MLKIIAIEHYIALPDFHNISIESEHTILDADIVIISPLFYRFWNNADSFDDGGRILFSKSGSDKVREIFSWRSQEFENLLKNGKIVIVFIQRLDYVDGEIRDTGKYEPITNYHWLPKSIRGIIISICNGTGSEMILKNPSHPFAPYFLALKDDLSYKAYLKEKDEYPNLFLINKSGNPVAWSVNAEKGFVIFIPPPPLKIDPVKLIDILIQCTKPLIMKDFRTPEPEWAKEFEIPGEKSYSEAIRKLDEEIRKQNENLEKLESEKESLCDYRALLYEQGKPLEEIIMRALRLMEFNAGKFHKDDMEHDIVLEAPEGRAIAEVEGRDNDAIHIDKFDQLTRVVDEDFKLHGVYSEGLLIGNHYRFTNPNERKDAFTEKARIAAGRKKFGLLTTVELFKAVIKILENPKNENFKKSCRIAILEAKGKQISFTTEK